MPDQTTSDPVEPDAAQPATQLDEQPSAQPSPRKQLLKRIGGAVLALVVFLGFRTMTADDGTHGIKVGECVATEGSNDFKKVDCAAPEAVGKVTFIATDTATTDAAALDVCEKHGAAGAFTSAEVENGEGTVVCVADL